jgi:hypothetical protein
MKYLKSFNQINESTFGDFISQSKPYWDLEDVEYDYIRDELDDIKGRHTITDREKSKIERILNVYLHTEVTGMKISDINTPAYGQDHCIDLQYEGCIIKPCDISVYCYEDDYFVLAMSIPVSTPSGNKTQYIVMEEFFYVIDGWDGLEEWAEKTTPYIGNEKIMSLLKSPLRELDSEMEEIDHDKFLELCDKYPFIRDGELKIFYFFDGGKHIATVRYNPIKDYYLQNSSGYSLQYDKSYKDKLF